MIRRLGHLCLTTDNLAGMLEFYTKTLGVPLKFTFHHKDGGVFGHYFDFGDSSFLEVFDRVGKHKEWGGTPDTLVNGNRYGHFCLEITGLRELKKALEAKGVAVSEIRTGMDHSLQAWIKDPDGNSIELMEYTAESWQIQR